MGKLIFLIAFYWIILLENGDQFLGVLFDLGNGLEIRLSLIFKFVFLLFNLLVMIHFDRRHGIPGYIPVFSIFLTLSTAWVWMVSPSGFMQALSVNVHIQLMLNIILFIKFNKTSPEQLHHFLMYLRLFALINALLVVGSAIFPDSGLFNSMTSKTGILRAFGIMGDEVSVFITFFLYESIVSRRYIHTGVYAAALLLTVGLGAIFTFLILLAWHFIFAMPKTRLNVFFLSGTIMLMIPVIYLTYASLLKTPVFQRMTSLTEQKELESSGLRMLSLQIAWDMIRERPLMGYGYGNYAQAVREKYRPRFVEIEKEKFFDGSAAVILTSTFNPFLQMVGESGLLGLLVFIWFLVKMYRSTKIPTLGENSPFYSFYRASRPWLLIFLITTLSANWLLPVSFLFLLVVTLVGVLYKINELNGIRSDQENS